jgi:hypothetical protein
LGRRGAHAAACPAHPPRGCSHPSAHMRETWLDEPKGRGHTVQSRLASEVADAGARPAYRTGVRSGFSFLFVALSPVAGWIPNKFVPDVQLYNPCRRCGTVETGKPYLRLSGTSLSRSTAAAACGRVWYIVSGSVGPIEREVRHSHPEVLQLVRRVLGITVEVSGNLRRLRWSCAQFRISVDSRCRNAMDHCYPNDVNNHPASPPVRQCACRHESLAPKHSRKGKGTKGNRQYCAHEVESSD